MERSEHWDTYEAFDMLNCEEAIYLEAMQVVDEDALRALFLKAYPDGRVVHNAEAVDEKAVNWSQVYAWLHGEKAH